MRHESHNGEGLGYAETTFSELTLGHLARHMGTRGTRKSNSVAADSVRGQMRHIGLRPQVMMRLGPSSSEHDKSSPGFQDLAMPLFESLYNFAHWLTQNREDAEDLVQETYVKALKGFASFQLGTNFRAWMFQVLKNTFLSSRARLEMGITIPRRSEEVLPVLTTSDTAESILVDRSCHDAVRSAIEQLPIIFREVILLCDVEEASYREIAETLSIPIVTVMSRLARARKAVRASLRSTPDATAEDKLALSRREPRKGY